MSTTPPPARRSISPRVSPGREKKTLVTLTYRHGWVLRDVVELESDMAPLDELEHVPEQSGVHLEATLM